MNLHAPLPADPSSPSPVESSSAVALSPDRATDPTAGLHAIRMSEIQLRPLDWLWPGWVPLGKLTLLDGDPSQAKSLLLVDLAARAAPRSG